MSDTVPDNVRDRGTALHRVLVLPP